MGPGTVHGPRHANADYQAAVRQAAQERAEQLETIETEFRERLTDLERRPTTEHQGEAEHRAARARRIADNPDAASDSDKLRTIADRIDLDDLREGRTGTQVQEFLRSLASRLESPVDS